MWIFKPGYQVAAGILLLAMSGLVKAELSLKQAEQLALDYDAVLQLKRSQAGALLEESVAADTLPDPRLKLGLMNFPTDTFERDQEPMTQVQVGIQQMFPRGDSLAIKSRQTQQSAEMVNASVDDRVRMVRLEVRRAYLDLIFWLQSEQVVKRNITLFRQLVDITQSQYAAGVQRQQDVIRAELELGMLDDRLDSIRTRQQNSSEALQKLIGTRMPDIQQRLPVLHTLGEETTLPALVEQHPLVRMEDAAVARGQSGIELAKQAYKPDWMLDVTYGFRDGFNPNGSERADFLSAMVSIDLPLFTGDKQDRGVAASRLKYQAALQAREERIRTLQARLRSDLADWHSLHDRVERYRTVIVPQSEENSKAALYAYQNRRGDFNSLMRARITELETGLNYLKLKIQTLKTQAKLLYLTGEAQ